MSCPDDYLDALWDSDLDLDEPPINNEPVDSRRHLHRRGRWMPIDVGPAIDDYQPHQLSSNKEEAMTKQEFDESRCAAVAGLHHCGNPEQDHLIDEIQHPESTEALYELPARPARQAK
ncbi:hypothetical protein [Kitasatospora sp. NPDC001175]|uniref:hypothetical protein n=1 Tax=Kitasatospora sp. NPDC001175 TaxID=3157103 RepID=UPI003D04B445